MTTRVYLDDSVISRLHYVGRRRRFLEERDAAIVVTGLIRLGLVEFVASEWLVLELAGGNEDMARLRIAAVPVYAEFVAITDEIWDRAAELATRSMSLWDATHTASAEFGKADVVLTFDARYVRGARSSGKLGVRVENVLDWVRHVYRA